MSYFPVPCRSAFIFSITTCRAGSSWADRVPDDLVGDVLILVPQNIPNPGNLRPWHMRELAFDIVGDTARGLRDDFEGPFNRAAGFDVLLELLERHASHKCQRLRNGAEDIVDSRFSRIGHQNTCTASCIT
jgi:hypothetical protein